MPQFTFHERGLIALVSYSVDVRINENICEAFRLVLDMEFMLTKSQDYQICLETQLVSP